MRRYDGVTVCLYDGLRFAFCSLHSDCLQCGCVQCGRVQCGCVQCGCVTDTDFKSKPSYS